MSNNQREKTAASSQTTQMQKSTDTLNEEQNTHKREQRNQGHPYINTAKASEGKQRMREQEKYY